MLHKKIAFLLICKVWALCQKKCFGMLFDHILFNFRFAFLLWKGIYFLGILRNLKLITQFICQAIDTLQYLFLLLTFFHFLKYSFIYSLSLIIFCVFLGFSALVHFILFLNFPSQIFVCQEKKIKKRFGCLHGKFAVVCPLRL